MGAAADDRFAGSACHDAGAMPATASRAYRFHEAERRRIYADICRRGVECCRRRFCLSFKFRSMRGVLALPDIDGRRRRAIARARRCLVDAELKER